jgi:hypothetical protein
MPVGFHFLLLLDSLWVKQSTEKSIGLDVVLKTAQYLSILNYPQNIQVKNLKTIIKKCGIFRHSELYQQFFQQSGTPKPHGLTHLHT